jgi:hypothetical protein
MSLFCPTRFIASRPTRGSDTLLTVSTKTITRDWKLGFEICAWTRCLQRCARAICRTHTLRCFTSFAAALSSSPVRQRCLSHCLRTSTVFAAPLLKWRENLFATPRRVPWLHCSKNASWPPARARRREVAPPCQEGVCRRCRRRHDLARALLPARQHLRASRHRRLGQHRAQVGQAVTSYRLAWGVLVAAGSQLDALRRAKPTPDDSNNRTHVGVPTHTE